MHWRLSDSRTAFDAEIVECTDDFLMSKMLHPTVKRSDALAKLSDCQSCIWCQKCCTQPWNGQMHWRNCLIVRAASNADVIRCTGEICLCVARYQTEKRASCWLMKWRRHGEASNGILLTMLQSETKHRRFDRCWSRPCQNWCFDDCSPQGKKIILTRITITSLDQNLLQLNQPGRIKFSSTNQSKSKFAADISRITSKTVFRRCI